MSKEPQHNSLVVSDEVLIPGSPTYEQITEAVSRVPERKDTPRAWWVLFGLSSSLAIMFFALGLLTAGLLALAVAPAIWRRAERLARTRIGRYLMDVVQIFSWNLPSSRKLPC